MSTDTPVSQAASKTARWIGIILSALPVAVLVLSGIMKLMKPAAVVQGFAKFGYPEATIVPLGVVEIACALLYVIPRTSVLGAILVTGYLGGATATNYRVGEGWWPTVLIGVLVWGGLFLRSPTIRSLIPLRRS